MKPKPDVGRCGNCGTVLGRDGCCPVCDHYTKRGRP